MITYAQNLEDVKLARLFGDQVTGFYVDIGASHPTELSVTRHFYDLGWSGLNIEPIRRNHELFVSERPRDINVNVAIGRVPGERTFYEVVELDALSTLDAEQAEVLAKSGYTVRSYPVRVATADQVFAEQGLDGRPIDFLKIDVEGSEGDVLASLDLRRFRPRVLVVEATKPASGFPGWDNFESVATHGDWEPRVLEAGYVFAHFDGISRFYVWSEEAGLAARLAVPPGFFDDIVAWKSVEERKELRHSLARELIRLVRAESQRRTLESRLKDARDAIADRDESLRQAEARNEALAARLEALSADLGESVLLRERLATELDEARTTLGDARADAARLRDKVFHFENMSLLGRGREAYRHVRRRVLALIQSLLWRVANGPRKPPLPRITLVTPAYNAADYIAETLESVLRQDYPDLEFIVVDGGSTDATVEIVRRFAARTDLPQRIARVVSEPDGGMYDAVAKGFDGATGSVYCYLNSDDLLEPGALASVGRHFADHPETMVVYHEDTVLVDGWKFPNARQPEGVDTVDLLDGHILFQDGVFFRREAYAAVGGMRRDLRLAGDFDLWLRLSSRFRLERRSGHRSCFRMRPGQLSLDMTRYHAEMERSRADFLAAAGAVRRVAYAVARRLRRLWRRAVRRRNGDRLFYPIDFGNLPPPAAIAPAGALPPPRSPVDGRPPERLLFSLMDTRFGERDLNYVYMDDRHGISITWPPVDPERLDSLYRKHYSSPPTEMVVPTGTSPYRQFSRQKAWERLLLRLPFERLGRFFPGIWSDNTLTELTTVLRQSGIDADSPLRLLDAGCFEGHLLDRIRESRPWRASGLEPNERAVGVARGKGHEVWHGHAESAGEIIPREQAFDVVFMGQSIEHVDDPVRVLRRLRQLLAPGGVLVMSTPNLDSREIDWFGPTWAHWHPPYHRHIFSKRGLVAIARQAGLEPRCFRTFSDPYWTAMSIAQNWLGLGGSTSHAVNFDRSIALRAQRIEVLKRLFWNRRDQGDYAFLVAGDPDD